ncbi:MAG: hypothetical protein H6853_05990 [Rhodospirillales bacterium]|nr:hypothetical protein [Alphaproteobacteria bacterium]USO03091.1 MAG: hypothetical protein H6853_05990 [Rhodospirillales bacterium]
MSQNIRTIILPLFSARSPACFALACLSVCVLTSASGPAQAQIDMNKKPVLVITNEPMPATDILPVYTQPEKAPDITPDQLSGPSYFEPTQTVVGQKIDTLRTDLFALQSRVSTLSGKLRNIESTTRRQASEYNANVATINTQLQAGTTPGNPRLVGRLGNAQKKLDDFSQSVAELNALTVDITALSSNASFLLDAAHATYSLSGAIEEDHVRLAQLEDQIDGIVVMVERLLNAANDDIMRTTAFLNAEHSNLRTLALGVTTGNMYGESLSNRPFTGGDMIQPARYDAPMAPMAPMAPVPPVPMSDVPAAVYDAPMAPVEPMAQVPMSGIPAAAPMPVVPVSPGRQPLAKIRFDRPDVNFQQPVYQAVSQAMERYPRATFEIVAVHPLSDNAAQMAIESTRARRNAEKVLRSLSQMGLPTDNIELTASQSPEAQTNEVHIFIR